MSYLAVDIWKLSDQIQNLQVEILNSNISTSINWSCAQTFLYHLYCIFYIVDGGWSDWSMWGACSVTCGTEQGVYIRTRECYAPLDNDCYEEGLAEGQAEYCDPPCFSKPISD